jgi:tellurite resistance protein TerC
LDLELLKWVIFIAGVCVALAIDLGVFNRTPHTPSTKEALAWCGVWFTLAMMYAVFVYYWKGERTALEFVTGYLIELSLSVDNLFVFLLIFIYFKTPAQYQHRTLYWGILGALIARGVMIGVGVALINAFEWIIYVFGALLIFTGIRMAIQEEHEVDPEKNPVVKLFRKLFKVSTAYHKEKFFIRQHGYLYATPLMVVLVVIETFDIVFAVDSIPAIFAVTRDPFVVFTSNVFAILGLRSLYFALASVMHKFHYLKYGLSIILTFVGVKMLLGHTQWAIPIGISLGVVAFVLIASVVASWIWPPKNQPLKTDPPPKEDSHEIPD